MDSSGQLRRLVSGEFSEGLTSFSGEWYASNGTRGSLEKTEETVCVDYAV